MGQAKVKKAAYEAKKTALLSACDAESRIVAESAIRLYENFCLPKNFVGGCYQTTFSLYQFLLREHGIETVPVVGYVNDGTDDIMISHAWLEHTGLKTDLMLHKLQFEGAGKPGSLMVLGQELKPGVRTYSYHRERSEAGFRALMELRENPQLSDIINHKEEEHIKMLTISKSDSLIEAYLNSAPPESCFEVFAAAMR